MTPSSIHVTGTPVDITTSAGFPRDNDAKDRIIANLRADVNVKNGIIDALRGELAEANRKLVARAAKKAEEKDPLVIENRRRRFLHCLRGGAIMTMESLATCVDATEGAVRHDYVVLNGAEFGYLDPVRVKGYGLTIQASQKLNDLFVSGADIPVMLEETKHA